MKFEYGPDAESRWRWRLRDANERVLAESIESYASEDECVDVILLVKSARNARLEKVERM